MYALKTIKHIIYDKYGVYLKKTHLDNFHLFTVLYIENIKTITIFNKTDSFSLNSAQEKRDFIARLFILWINYENERKNIAIIEDTRVNSLVTR